MGKKNRVSLLCKSVILLLVMLSSASGLTELSRSVTTTVYVYPSSKTVVVGQSFSVYIKISDVTDLYGWEFKLSWNPNLLDVIDVTEGPFLKQGGDTFFTKKINNTAGYILVDCTLLGDVPGVSGDGTLASVKFYAEEEGSTVLDLYDTILLNSLEQTIPHTANDGSVTVSQSVGGIDIPVDKLALLAPWFRTGLAVVFALVMVIVFTKYLKKKNKLPVSYVNAIKGAS
jgi:hypothetical protein